MLIDCVALSGERRPVFLEFSLAAIGKLPQKNIGNNDNKKKNLVCMTKRTTGLQPTASTPSYIYNKSLYLCIIYIYMYIYGSGRHRLINSTVGRRWMLCRRIYTRIYREPGTLIIIRDTKISFSPRIIQ